MGAKCSSDSSHRYDSVKKKIMTYDCLSFHAIDGLVSENGHPIWLIGEHHDTNESIEKKLENCLRTIDIVGESVSDCGNYEKGANVYFLYENPVISDNEFFPSVNPNMVFEEDKYLDNIVGTRAKVESTAYQYTNIIPIPMDVFGRMRIFNNQGEYRNTNHTRAVAANELKEFWKSVGYPSQYFTYINERAIELSSIATRDFFIRFPNTSMTYPDVSEAYTVAYLAKLSFQITVQREGILRGRKMAMKELDNIMLAIFSRTPEKLENAIVLDGIEGGIDVYRDVLRKVYLFELLSVAGDMVVFEYITSSKSSDSLYIMHAGYNHSNRIRKWLLETDYISDYERVTDQAVQDKIFNESRG